MLPEAAQARKAIWDAVNPKTGRRRIDEAFPPELRSNSRDTDMFMRLKSGSTWQVVGSDNFNSLMGSPPIGIVFSEWALANPQAWAFLSPILEENGGWAAFITTPRGRNHAFRSYELAKQSPGWFAELLPATETPVFTPEQLERIRLERIAEFGEDDGEALFAQEYMCSFDAPLVGSYYAKILAKMEAEGRFIENLPFVANLPVQTAWDIGYHDDLVIWFFQPLMDSVLILDHVNTHGIGVPEACEIVHDKARERGWTYGPQDKQMHWVPWDAKPKTFASPNSVIQQAWACGIKMVPAPNLSVQDGIQSVRKVLPICYFDKTTTQAGIDNLRAYQREWDDGKKMFKNVPLHNFASHDADGFRYLSLAVRQVERPAPPPPEIKGLEAVTLDRMFQDRIDKQGYHKRI